MALVLYHVEDAAKEKQLSALCRELHLTVRRLTNADRDRAVATLCGEKVNANVQKAPAGYKLPEVLIFSGFAGEMLDVFLAAYKKAGSMGSDEDWDMATEALRGALDDLGLPYVVNEGDGAFYGPKIDFHLEDSIGRTWQCGTIQLDFQLPLRFNLEYTGADGEKHRPIMIHRVIFGSIERFIGILIEHFAGAFPTWLAPVQVKVLPISDKYMDYAQKVLDELNNSGVRAEIDTRAEKIGYKIREAQMKKIPYMLVVGAKEEEDGLVSIRSRFEGDEGQKSLTDFLAAIKMEIQAKTAREVKKEDDK